MVRVVQLRGLVSFPVLIMVEIQRLRAGMAGPMLDFSRVHDFDLVLSPKDAPVVGAMRFIRNGILAVSLPPGEIMPLPNSDQRMYAERRK